MGAGVAPPEDDVDSPVVVVEPAAAAAVEDHQADLQALGHQLRDVPDVVALAVDPEDPAHAARTAADQEPSEA